jgi:hypothetical protein
LRRIDLLEAGSDGSSSVQLGEESSCASSTCGGGASRSFRRGLEVGRRRRWGRRSTA